MILVTWGYLCISYWWQSFLDTGLEIIYFKQGSRNMVNKYDMGYILVW